MKTIYLIRHAETEEKKKEQSDFVRQLNSNGNKQLHVMSNQLKKLDFKPSLFISSSAKRTTSTAKFMANDKPVIYMKSIYESSLSNLIKLINEFPNDHSKIALIGHNPSLNYLSNYLTDEIYNDIPPCSIIKIELEIENWNEVIQGIGIQKFFIYPKMFIV
jgi:phosphohistidine phosphatase